MRLRTKLFFLWLLLFPALSYAQKAPAAEVLSVAGKSVPVYEGFDALLPLLREPDDALLVVNFWATWCAPCVKELPYFEELVDGEHGKRVRVLLVNLDFRKQLRTRLLPFLEKHSVRADVVVLDDPDANAWIDRVDSSWSGAIPATLFLGPGIREFHEQSFTR
ncbi:MAG: TlpA disulfide reductase family protein, partial [Bacteroidota bacterium]|nr:TlpA disulfide reductase family protein [Bacteroidota bacterium]